MATVYIAINGDDVGSRIGEAIASDNHDELRSASDSIKAAHGSVEEWVQAAGGQTISSSGDEGIYLVPEDALKELDGIRDQYKEASGHALTVGVGHSMSEASKALIYGKLNGKNQVVHYEPSIDDYLSEEDIDEADQVQDEAPAAEADAMEEAPAEGEIPTDEEVVEAGAAEAEEEVGLAPEQAMVDEATEDAAAEDEKDEQDADIIEDDQEQLEADAIDGEQPDGEDEAIGIEDEPEASPETELLAEGDVAPEEEAAMEEQAAMSDDEAEAAMDEMAAEGEDASVPPEMLEAAAEEQMAAEAPPEEEAPSPYDELAPEEAPAEGEEISEEEAAMADESGEYDYNDALADMIQGDMEGEVPPEEAAAEDPDLKQDIAAALMAFKSNRDQLEMAREQNPELYDAMITMLRSMIDMAKKLGYSPEQDMAEAEAAGEMTESFPDAEQADEYEEDPAEKKQ